jgi:predicted enzyme related to lactoylglutathione lyase
LYETKAFYAAAFPNWSFREETSKDANGGEVIHFSAGKPEGILPSLHCE